MNCKNCGNELEENEKYCGKCGTKVENNISNVETKSNENTDNKEPIKIKFTYFIIGIVILFLIPVCMVFINSSNGLISSNENANSEIYSNNNKINKDWMIKINNQKVFNIDYEEFVEKCKNELEALSNMSVENTKNGVVYGGEIAYPTGWLVVKGENYTNYVGGELTFEQLILARMIFIEEYQGKVKKITYLKETNTLNNPIAEHIISELLESYGIYTNKLDNYLNIENKEFTNAFVSIGKFEGGIAYARANVEPSYVAGIYRRNGSFGYIPYEYNNKESGNYITLSVK